MWNQPYEQDSSLGTQNPNQGGAIKEWQENQAKCITENVAQPTLNLESVHF